MHGEDGIRGGELAALERADQLDAAAGAVGFVAGGEESGAGLEAEAAVNARVQPGEPIPALPPPFPRGHSLSVATTSALPGSKVRRSPATSGPTPSR